MKISIITTVFNAHKTINQTIKSVLSQNYKNLEYIIIDACSTDGTSEIITSYGNKIIHIREPDNGIYFGMNKGLKMTTGDIIGIINADDFYLPGTIHQIVDLFDQNKKVEILHGKIANISDDKITGFSKPHNHKLLYYIMCIKHPTCFIKKEVYQRVGIFNQDYKVASDYDFLLRCYIGGVIFSYLDKTLVGFRRGGYSDKHKIASIKEQIKIRKKHKCKCVISIGFLAFISFLILRPIILKLRMTLNLSRRI